MKWYSRFFLIVVTLVLGIFLYYRQEAILSGNVSAVDTLITAVFIALLLLQVFPEVTLGGVTLKSKIEEIVHKSQLEALQLSAQRDLLMMPIWEKEHSNHPYGFSTEKINLIEKNLTELENLWKNSKPDEKVHYGLALRQLYWDYLDAARHHWASGEGFQNAWRRVEKGFSELGNVKYESTR